MTTNEASVAPKKTSALQIAAAWLFVGGPLAWGVLQTVNKSLALFR